MHRNLSFTLVLAIAAGCATEEAPEERDEGVANRVLVAPWTDYFGGSLDSPTAPVLHALDEPSKIVRIGGGIQTPDAPTASDRAKLEQIRSTVARGGEVIFVVSGFSGDPATFIENQRRDPDAWNTDLRNQIRYIYGTGEDREARMRSIHFELFNEINSRTVSLKLCAWRKDVCPPEGTPFDRKIIEPYLRYAFVPSVLAIKQENPNAKISTGSVLEAFDPNVLEWYRALLNHYLPPAPPGQPWSGPRVNDVVDFLNVHYPVTATDKAQASDDGLSPFASLDTIYAMRARPTQGVISSEELGTYATTRGFGAATVLRIVATYLDYWGARDLGPDRAKVSLWGWWLGAAGNITNDGKLGYGELVRAFGAQSRVQTLPAAFRIVGKPDGASNVDGHAYCVGSCATPGARRYVVVIHAKDDRAVATIQDFDLALPAPTLASLRVAEAYHYPKRNGTARFRDPVATTVTPVAGRARVHLGRRIDLGYQADAPTGERRSNTSVLVVIDGE